MIQIENPDEVYSWGIKELWNAVTQILEDTDEDGITIEREYEKELEIVKNGKYIKVPIYYLTNEWYEIYPSSRRVQIKGHGKKSLIQFMEDKQEREKILRRIILESIDNESTTQPRT